MLVRVAVLFVLLAAKGVFAATEDTQGTKKRASPGASGRSEPSKSKTRPKLSLAEITRVTSAEAAGSASRKATKEYSRENSTAESSTADVTEFHPASPDETPVPSAGAAAHSENSKNIHGTVYGGSDVRGAGRARVGGAVGAGSKSGRRHIYVEADQTRAKRPSP